MTADLRAQGLTQQQGIELVTSLWMGKAASVAEQKNGSWGSSPLLAEGVKHARKYGEATLDSVLKDGIKAGDSQGFEDHIQTFVESMTRKGGTHRTSFCTRLMTKVTLVRRLTATDTQMLQYFTMYFVKRYPGRLIPVTLDNELILTVQNQTRGMMRQNPQEEAAPTAKEKAVPDAGSSGQLKELSDTMSASFKSLAESMKAMNGTISDLQKSSQSAASKIQSMEAKLKKDKGATPEGRKCFGCGKSGHMIQDCPEADKE